MLPVGLWGHGCGRTGGRSVSESTGRTALFFEDDTGTGLLPTLMTKVDNYAPCYRSGVAGAAWRPNPHQARIQPPTHTPTPASTQRLCRPGVRPGWAPPGTGVPLVSARSRAAVASVVDPDVLTGVTGYVTPIVP